MENKQKRQSPYERDPNPPRIVMNERDKQIIDRVYQCRVLRQDQLHALFFGSSTSASQKRLRLLFDHYFLNRVPLKVGDASYLASSVLYVVDSRGAALLRREFGQDKINWKSKKNKVSQDFFEHTVEVNDVLVAVTLACKSHQGYSLLEWQTESQLRAKDKREQLTFKNQSNDKSLIPDSFFVLQTPQGKAPFFLEVDRGNESLGKFKTKIERYQSFVQSGEYTKSYGYRSLRVLITASDLSRLKGLKRVTEAAGGKERYWFALHSNVTSNAVLEEPIWWMGGSTQQTELFSWV